MGFPGSSYDKETAHNASDYLNPWVQKTPWRKEWPPTPVFLPEEFRGQRSLASTVNEVTKSDITEWLTFSFQGKHKTKENISERNLKKWGRLLRGCQKKEGDIWGKPDKKKTIFKGNLKERKRLLREYWQRQEISENILKGGGSDIKFDRNEEVLW